MPTVNAIAKLIGTTPMLVVISSGSGGSGSLRVPVVVKDARLRFGIIDCLIEPVIGSGSIWVQHTRLDWMPLPPRVGAQLAAAAIAARAAGEVPHRA